MEMEMEAACQGLRVNNCTRLTTREKLKLSLGIIVISTSTLLLVGLVLGMGIQKSISNDVEILGSKKSANYEDSTSRRLQNSSNTNPHEEVLFTSSKNLFLAELRELRKRNEICETGDCKSLASNLLSSMNISTDPCTNFYEFSCGQRLNKGDLQLVSVFNNELDNLLGEPLAVKSTLPEFKHFVNNVACPVHNAHKLPDFLNQLKHMDDSRSEIVPINQAGEFYHNCLNQSETVKSVSLFDLTNVIKSNGGWPLVSTHSWDGTNFDWANVSGTYEHEFASSAFLRVTIQLDIKETSKHVIHIDQPESLSPFTHKTLAASRLWALMLMNLVRSGNVTAPDLTKVSPQNQEELEELIDFMIELNNISDQTNSTKSMVEQAKESYHNFTLSNLEREIGFRLRSYMEKHVFRSKLELSSDEKIIVGNPSYMKKLFPLIQRTRSRIIANALHFYLIHNLLKGIIPELTTLSTFGSREEYCRAYIKHFFGLAAYYKISQSRWKSDIRSDDKEEAIAKIHEIIETQREVFMDQISNSFFDPETEAKARAKLAATRAFVGKPSWLTAEMMEEHYIELSMPSANHVGNLRELIIWQMGKRMKSLRRPTEEDTRLEILSAGLLQDILEPTYIPFMNSFVIPDAMLKAPFFSLKYPASINHGALGFVLAHELAHGFDTEQLHFDASGNLGTWLSSASQEILNQKATCFQNQYEQFQPIPGQHVNGTLTLNENLADNSGIAVAFSAYQKYIQDGQTAAVQQAQQRLPGLEKFTHEQLFFIAFAHPWCEKRSPSTITTLLRTDTHSPSRFRVLGSLMNSQAFSKVWSCPVGSKMNPKRKCSVWNV